MSVKTLLNIDQLKKYVNNDIAKPKFDEKKVKIDENIKNIVLNLAKYKALSFNQKELELIIKYISFGKEYILESDLPKISNSEIFKNDLRNFIERG